MTSQTTIQSHHSLPSPSVGGPSSRTGHATARTCLLATLLLGTLPALVGCATNGEFFAPAPQAVQISGTLHGGNQPVTGSRVYLYAAGTAANGGAATSLLAAPGYVTTDGNGAFNFTSLYTCPAGGYVYLLALGGNPGLTPTPPATTVNNAKLAMASGIGACPLSPLASYNIDEVTTVATAYALAQFTTSETQIGAAPAYATGLGNAFGNIPNIVSLSTGRALPTTPFGNGIVPATTLNSLANSLAPCVNSDGSGTPCAALMSDTNTTGAGGTPIDTFQAAINIAKNPGVKTTNIFNDAQPNAPFQPALTAAPNDYSLTVQYLGQPNPNIPNTRKCADSNAAFTDICQAQGIAIDQTGNVWITSFNPDSNGAGGVSGYDQGEIVKFSPAGAELSPAGGYTTPYLYRLNQLAFDSNNVAWTGTRATTVAGTAYPDAIVRISQTGAIQTYTGGGIVTPRGIAVDAYNNIWTAGPGVMAEFTNGGVPVSGTGYQSATLTNGTFKMAFDHLGNAWSIGYNQATLVPTLNEFTPVSRAQNLQGTYGGTFTQSIMASTGAISDGIAIDANNNVFTASTYTTTAQQGTGFLAKYSNAGVLLSGTAGYTAGGILYPNDVVIDGNNNAFGTDSPLGYITNTGAAISPPSGYQSPNGNDCCFTGAIDNSGNLWLTGGIGLYQVIGIAVPVITPQTLTIR